MLGVDASSYYYNKDLVNAKMNVHTLLMIDFLSLTSF
jgi:hypothetical protein